MTIKPHPWEGIAGPQLAARAIPPSASGEVQTGDEFVAARDQAHDAQRAATDLAAAPTKDRQRLADEQARLDALRAAAADADNVVVKARGAIVDARMAGKNDEPAVQEFDLAEQAATRARWEVDLQTEVVTGLRDRLILAVRHEQAAQAHAHLNDARERWQAALARVVPMFDALDGLRAAHAAEKAAADELAYARAEYHNKFDDQGYRQRAGPDGAQYVTSAEPAITVNINGELVASADELVARLRG